MNGWINLYKRKNISSAYAVYLCKKTLQLKNTKIGHAGTLDKEAEGVLPIALGKTTKLIKFLLDCKKSYVFKIKFGTKTNTGDSSGKILEISNNTPILKEIKKACKNFMGKISQIPPKYSSIKINGMRAYKLARENRDFYMKKRSVIIYKFFCLNYNYQERSASFFVECSSGTYIRTLAEDLAKSLSNICYVNELQRVSVGKFKLTESLNSNNLIKRKKTFSFEKNLVYYLLDPEYALEYVKFFTVNAEQVSFISKGNNCFLDCSDRNYNLVFIKYKNEIVSFGYLYNRLFTPTRVLI